MNNKEVDISALLDLYVYMDNQHPSFENLTIAEALQTDTFKNNVRTDEQNRNYEKLLEAVNKYPELAQTVIRSQSMVDSEYSKEILIAAAFETPYPSGSIIFAYRGTGDGKWVDNGEGMYKSSTKMQEAAAGYFDSTLEELYPNELEREEARIITTGHSKGGNSAQYVTIMSRNAAYADVCYSFDGQGFSKEAINNFKARWGDDYEIQRNKMFSINGENDYVHVLGLTLIPSANTLYLATGDAKDFAEYHDLYFMFDKGEHVIDLANPVEQDELGLFARKLSSELMELNDKDIKHSALAIMSLLERYMGGGEDYLVGTGDVEFASLHDFAGFISAGVPLIIKTAVTSEEGRAMVGKMAIDAITGIAKSENGGLKLVGLTALIIECAPAIVTLGAVVWAGATVIDSVYGLIDGTLTLADLSRTILAGTILMNNPLTVAAVLAVVAMIALVTYIVENWKDIVAFVKSVKDKVMGAAAALYAWTEHLVSMGAEIIKNAVQKATEMYQNAKRAIVEFRNDLMNAAGEFFKKLGKAVMNFFGTAVDWLKGLFGSATSALAVAATIAATISQIDEMQRRLIDLRIRYLDARTAANKTSTIVSMVSSYYNESYVQSCCCEIEKDIRNAQKFIDTAERNLDKRCRVLATAVDIYYRTDQNARRDLRVALYS